MPAALAAILSMLAWEGAARGAGFLGRRLLGKGAAELATGAGTKLAATKLGGHVATQAAKMGRVGAYLTPEALTKGAITGAAGVGSLAAGMAGMNFVDGLIDPRDPGAASMAIAGLPSAEHVNASNQMGQMVNQTALRSALVDYLGGDEALVEELLATARQRQVV